MHALCALLVPLLWFAMEGGARADIPIESERRPVQEEAALSDGTKVVTYPDSLGWPSRNRHGLPIGSPCKAESQCLEHGYCIKREFRQIWPEGYCTVFVPNGKSQCPAGTTPQTYNSYTACLTDCQRGCRTNYVCHRLVEENGAQAPACVPSCPESPCSPYYSCDSRGICTKDSAWPLLLKVHGSLALVITVVYALGLGLANLLFRVVSGRRYRLLSVYTVLPLLVLLALGIVAMHRYITDIPGT